MHSKRSESVVTAQYKMHERSSIEAAAWATQHQRNGISPTAPWRFVRDPVKLLLRSLCSRCALYALVAINALPRRLHNLWIVRPRRSWCFSCVSSALMLRSWRLHYTHDCHCTTADQGIKRPRFHCYRYYLLALKTLHNSRFSRFKMPTHQKRKAKSKTGPAQETNVTQPEPQEGASQAPARQAPSPQAEPDPPHPEPSRSLLSADKQGRSQNLLALLLLGWFSSSYLASLWYIIASCIIATGTILLSILFEGWW